MNKEKKRALVVPLNWGLGHATRLIPCIRGLLSLGMEVFIGGSEQHKKIFREEFIDLKEVELPYINIRLSHRKSQVLKITLQVPYFMVQVWREHIALKRLIRKYKIDFVISDSCYGLWNRKVCSVFITHQMHIKLPGTIHFLEKSLNFLNHTILRQFDECWIPDYEDNGGFAGALSHTLAQGVKTKYVGILSRFSEKSSSEKIINKKKILFIISGPEKQRSPFRKPYPVADQANSA